MTVYFMRRDTDGPIKIGRSSASGRRLQIFQTAMPEDLSFVAEFNGPDDVTLEGFLHKVFEEHRIHPKREWFRPDEEILFWTKPKTVKIVSFILKLQKSAILASSEKETNQFLTKLYEFFDIIENDTHNLFASMTPFLLRIIENHPKDAKIKKCHQELKQLGLLPDDEIESDILVEKRATDL